MFAEFETESIVFPKVADTNYSHGAKGGNRGPNAYRFSSYVKVKRSGGKGEGRVIGRRRPFAWRYPVWFAFRLLVASLKIHGVKVAVVSGWIHKGPSDQQR